MRYERRFVTFTSGCVLIVNWLEVLCGAHHCALAVATGSSVQLFVHAAHSTSVEASGGQGVDRFVNSGLLEDFTSLLSHSLTQMVIVDMNTRTITLVARNNSRLFGNGSLNGHVISACAVEVTR